MIMMSVFSASYLPSRGTFDITVSHPSRERIKCPRAARVDVAQETPLFFFCSFVDLTRPELRSNRPQTTHAPALNFLYVREKIVPHS